MHSTELPVTEYWDPDPEWEVYDVPPSPDDGLVDAWYAASMHLWVVQWLGGGLSYWLPFHGRELTTGCRCRETPGWYPGRPAVDGCPLHKPHRCNTAALGRSWRSEGCGWRCPTCGAEWTLTIVHKLYEEHATPYGTHPASQCGPAFCTLLPPRPVMEWTRDEVTA